VSSDLELYRDRTPGRDVVDGWTGVIAEISKLSTVVSETDFVPKTLRGKPAAITACILAGREVGIPPMRALQHLHMVDGRPTMSAEQKRAQALAAGHHIVYVETTTERCIVKGRRRDSDEWTTVTWSMDDAKRASLQGKDNYRKHPRRMLQARATGELCDLLFPDASGGLATYEQAMDETDAAAAASNGHANPPRATAQRRTPVRATAPPAQQAADEPADTAAPVLPPLPGEPGYDDPTTPPPMPAGITKAQGDKMFAVLNQLGVTDRNQRLDLCSRIVNRTVATAKDLTKDEASALIDTLETATRQDDPRAWLDEVIRSLPIDGDVDGDGWPEPTLIPDGGDK